MNKNLDEAMRTITDNFLANLGIKMAYIGERKNLRDAQRRVGNVCKTPRGYHYYDGKHWQKMDVPKSINTKECYASQQKLLNNF